MPKLSAGVGIGFEFLKETYLPAFVNIEYKLRNSYSTPYLFLKTGYEVPLEDANPIYNYEIQPFYYDNMICQIPAIPVMKWIQKADLLLIRELVTSECFHRDLVCRWHLVTSFTGSATRVKMIISLILTTTG